jgi:hypothetical protein
MVPSSHFMSYKAQPSFNTYKLDWTPQSPLTWKMESRLKTKKWTGGRGERDFQEAAVMTVLQADERRGRNAAYFYQRNEHLVLRMLNVTYASCSHTPSAVKHNYGRQCSEDYCLLGREIVKAGSSSATVRKEILLPCSE